jgi:hypothetical protein
MKITTPKYRIVLWGAANVGLIAAIPAAMIYYYRELNAGAYPADADSISIPIIGIAMRVAILIIPLNALCWLLLRGYPGTVALTTSSKGVKFSSRLIAELCLVFGALCAVAAAWSAIDLAPEFALVFLLWCYITIAIRAAFLGSARLNTATKIDSIG